MTKTDFVKNNIKNVGRVFQTLQSSDPHRAGVSSLDSSRARGQDFLHQQISVPKKDEPYTEFMASGLFNSNNIKLSDQKRSHTIQHFESSQDSSDGSEQDNLEPM